MDKAIEQAVRLRAKEQCEYCLIPQAAFKLTFHIEHIIARKHGGADLMNNLALACGRCNCSKGSNISGIDPHTHAMVRLYNPRNDKWRDHFRYDGPVIVGLTEVGRATVEVLGMNNPYRMAARQALIDEDIFPPRSQT